MPAMGEKDTATKEIQSFLTERDKEVLARHKELQALYAPGSLMGDTWSRVEPGNLVLGHKIARVIIDAAVLPPPADSQKIPLLVSLSANAGITEMALSLELGDSYRVIAGDMAPVARFSSHADSVRMDASFLPFAKQSVAALLDLKGALWHEADYDLRRDDRDRVDAENMLDLFQRLREYLVDGGVLIVDDAAIDIGGFYQADPGGTGVKIDTMLRLSRKKLEGFTVSTIGNGKRRLRVYTKV